jgi:hypothetical protein
MTPEYKELINNIHTVLSEEYRVVSDMTEETMTSVYGWAGRHIYLTKFTLDTCGWVYNFSPTSTRYIPLTTLETIHYEITHPNTSTLSRIDEESLTTQIRPFPTAVPIYTHTNLAQNMYWQFFLENPVRMPDGQYLYAYCWNPLWADVLNFK